MICISSRPLAAGFFFGSPYNNCWFVSLHCICTTRSTLSSLTVRGRIFFWNEVPFLIPPFPHFHILSFPHSLHSLPSANRLKPSSAHFPISPFPHFHILSFPHSLHSLPSANRLIPSSAHFPIPPFPHFHILSFPHSLIFTFSHSPIFSLAT